jgi:hypothetical protein
MKDKHYIIIDTIENPKALKKMVYSKMNDVYSQHEGSNKNFRELNVMVLSDLKEYYLEKSKLLEAQKPNLASLNRDAMIYGNRQVNINELIPEGNPYLKKDALEVNNLSLDKLITDREIQVNGGVPKVRPDITRVSPQVTVTPESADDFEKRLNSFQHDRDSVLPKVDPNINIPSFTDDALSQDVVMNRLILDDQTNRLNSIENQDPKSFFSQPFTSELLGNGVSKDIKPFQNDMTNTIDTPFLTSENFINPRNNKHKEVERYLSINSADRNWNIETMRYKYSVNSLSDSNDLQKKYRNIDSIKVGKVVIPEEIIERTSSTLQNLKTTFNYNFSFAYPYIILNIAEFEDVYDGTNDSVRKAFCKLIYEQSYKAPNGRGYIILKPMQHEKKKFYPTPLSSFGKLSVSLLKPNGELLNTSADSYKLFKVEYEAFNVQYLKIVSDVYFDKNEFFVGDNVLFQDHNMTQLDNNINTFYIKQFNDFINRPQGHEIKQIGSANDSGFFRTFYIQAPGSFDKVNGRYVVDNNLINTLNLYNDQVDFCAPETLPNGRILNNSLQHTISMKLEMIIDDAKIIDANIL